jgi:hypothetical protein
MGNPTVYSGQPHERVAVHPTRGFSPSTDRFIPSTDGPLAHYVLQAPLLDKGLITAFMKRGLPVSLMLVLGALPSRSKVTDLTYTGAVASALIHP